MNTPNTAATMDTGRLSLEEELVIKALVVARMGALNLIPGFDLDAEARARCEAQIEPLKAQLAQFIQNNKQ